MEAALLVFLLIVVFVLAFKKKAKDEDVRPRRTPSRQKSETEHRPFDAKSAHNQSANPTVQAANPTVQGPAYVVDGDTVVIQKTQIRLFGVDAPEMEHPYGKKAKWALVSLCKGQTIRAEITDKDAYDRTVARCYLPDGRDLSAEMVKLGLAIDWPKFSGGKYGSMEVPGIRKKLWLADARQKGRMHVWEQFEARSKAKSTKN